MKLCLDKDVLCIAIVVPVFASLGPILSMFLASGAQPGPISLIWLLWLLPPPSQHLQYLLTLDMQLISLLYHWLFTSLHIFAWGLEKTQSSICTDSFCKIYQLSMACYQFIFDRRDLFPHNSLHHHISTNIDEIIWKTRSRKGKNIHRISTKSD